MTCVWLSAACMSPAPLDLTGPDELLFRQFCLLSMHEKKSVTGCLEVNAFTNLGHIFYYLFGGGSLTLQLIIQQFTHNSIQTILVCSCITNLKSFPVPHLHTMFSLGVARKRKLFKKRLLRLGFQTPLSPLNRSMHYTLKTMFLGTHQAAPTTDKEILKPMPRLAHIKGEVSVRNLQKMKEHLTLGGITANVYRMLKN